MRLSVSVARTAASADAEPPERPIGAARLWRTNQGYRSLWSARTCSYLGDSILLVILVLHLAETTGQALTVALLLLVGDFTPALLSPLTGTISDRFGPKRVMIVCDVTQAATVLLMLPVADELVPLLVLVGVRAMAGQIFQPASRSLVPSLVSDDELDVANAGLGVGVNLAEILGPIIAAALLSTVDASVALLGPAIVFGTSALVAGTLPTAPDDHSQEAPDGFWASARSGLSFVWSTSMVKIVTLGFVGSVAFNGIDDVALVFLATDVLGGSTAQAALLYASVGLGLVVGFVILSTPWVRRPLLPLLVVGLAVVSAGNLFTGLAWAVGVAFALQTVRGVGIAALDVAVATLLQRSVPPDMLGRVFGNVYGAVGLAAGLSCVLGGLALSVTSARTVFVVGGAGALVITAAMTAALLRHTRARSTRRTPPQPRADMR